MKLLLFLLAFELFIINSAAEREWLKAMESSASPDSSSESQEAASMSAGNSILMHRGAARPIKRTRFLSKPMNTLKNLIQKAYNDWKAFKAHHKKRYENEDVEHQHMLIFIKNKQIITQHNEAFRRGEVSFTLGESWITDLSRDQYKLLNGFRRMLGDANGRLQNATRFLRPSNVDIPETWDWRDHGYVTEIKNQGMCGSCWAFSATGSLEGQHMRSSGSLVSLSEQNLIDCSTTYGNNGCNGGMMDNAFQYIKENHGIDTEDSYPYKARDQKSCRFKESSVGAEDTGYSDLSAGDEDALKVAVATQGPVSVAIDASHSSFQHYKSSVYFEKQCSSQNLDHGVLVVGYGTDPEHGDYWIVKNSWGKSWGESGYIQMARNRDNHCGIATHASFPTV